MMNFFLTGKQAVREEIDQLDQWLKDGKIDADKHQIRIEALRKEYSETNLTSAEMAKGWAVIGTICIGVGFGVWSIFDGSSKAIENVNSSATASGNLAPSPAYEEQPRRGSDSSANNHQLAFRINAKTATIEGVGLGAGPEACSADIEEIELGNYVGYGVLLDKFVANVCDMRKDNERTRLVYDTSASHVIAIERRLFVNHRDVSIDQLITNAEEYYGPAEYKDEGNWELIWGDAFDAEQKSVWQENRSGRGLTIYGRLCGMGGEDEECRRFPDATVTINFNMADLDEVNAARLAGKSVAEASKHKAADIDF